MTLLHVCLDANVMSKNVVGTIPKDIFPLPGNAYPSSGTSSHGPVFNVEPDYLRYQQKPPMEHRQDMFQGQNGFTGSSRSFFALSLSMNGQSYF